MSISCTSCRHANDAWRRFCGGCGSGLPGGCKACGAVNRTSDRFCGGCGKSVRTLPPSITKPAKKFDSTVPIEIADVLSETPV